MSEARFSLAPPSEGDNTTDGSTVPGFPSIGCIKEMAVGDLGIADSMNQKFVNKQMASSTLKESETETFMNSAGSDFKKPVGSYKKPSGNYDIPQGDINFNEGGKSGGLPALEKTLAQSVFETQKPYLEVSLAVLGALVVSEDITAILKGGDNDKSLKPKTNQKSLQFKLNNLKSDIGELENISKSEDSSISKFSEKDRKEGIDIDELTDSQDKTQKTRTTETSSDIGGNWEIISIDYSTGGFIPGIPYKYIYRDIEEDDNNTRRKEGKVTNIKESEKPPVIVFDILHNKLNIGPVFDRLKPSELPNDWDVSSKWYGKWDKWTADPISFIKEYNKHTDETTERKLDENGVRDSETRSKIKTIVQNASPSGDSSIDFYKEYKKSSLEGEIIESSSDFLADYYKIQPKFGLKPKTIKWKGKDVTIDPMNDYYIQITKITPDKNNTPVKESNGHLSGPNPTVSRYEQAKVYDTLLAEDFKERSDNDPAKHYWKTKDPNIIHSLNRWDNTTADVDDMGELTKFGSISTTNEGIPVFKDTSAIYIVEGISINRKEAEQDKTPQTIPDEDYYQWASKTRKGRSIVKATTRFVDFSTLALPAVLIATSIALEVFKKPHNFIFEVLLEKLSLNFQGFSPNITKKFSRLRKKKTKKEKKKYLNENDDLKKFISMDKEGNLRWVFDGASVMTLLGFGFGIGLVAMSPSLILNDNGLGLDGCQSPPVDRRTDKTGIYEDNAQNTGTRSVVPQNERLLDGEFEIVNIEYSTGDYINGINYKYYYITIDNEQLVTQGDLLVEKANKIASNDPAESISLKLDAMEKYEEALSRDPKNLFIQDKISELSKDQAIQNNIMIQMLMNIITIPIKAATCIVEYILDFFTSLKVLELPVKILEFLSFKWMIDIVKPSSTLKVSGLDFAPDLMVGWIGQLPAMPKTAKLDMSQVLGAPFLGKLPTYDSRGIRALITGGNKILLAMVGIFTLFELFLNAIMCFELCMCNAGLVIPCPEISLSKFVKEGLTQEEINRILAEQDHNFVNPNNIIKQEPFVYDIQLEDGTVIRELNQAELGSFVESNSDLKYKFLYND